MGNFDVASSGKPSFEDRIKIVDALLACDYIRDGERRKTILSQLDEEFPGIANTIARRNDNKTDVTEIVSTCLKHPGSLEELAKIVAYYEGEASTPVQWLRRVLHDLFFEPQVISRELFDELIELMAQVHITQENLWPMYAKSTPFGWQRLDFQDADEAELLKLVIRDLSLARQTDGTLPLIEFVKLIAGVSVLEVQGKLRAWRTKAANYAKVPDTDTASYKQSIPVEQSKVSFSYLLVTIDPYYVLEENEFNVRAWFLEEYTGDPKQDQYKYEPLSTSSKPYSLDALPGLLEQLTSQCLKHMDVMKDLVVELFLPLAFLNAADCNIHQWMIDKGLKSYKAISCVYPLVVRSLDRIKFRNEHMRRQWDRNWRMLNQQGTIANPRFVSSEHCEEALSLEGEICLAFTIVPPPIQYSVDKPARHIFTWMLRDGTPVALWPRSNINFNETQMKRAYKKMLSGRHFSELPEMIWKKRKEEKHLLVNCLTLFWDDPNRVPPDDEVEAPAVY